MSATPNKVHNATVASVSFFILNLLGVVFFCSPTRSLVEGRPERAVRSSNMYFPVVLVDSCCTVVLLRYSVLRLGLESAGPGQLHNSERSEILLVRHGGG